MRISALFTSVFLALSLFAAVAQAQTPAKNPLASPIDGPGSTLSQKSYPAAPHSPKLPYGLQLMARFDLLPLLRDSVCLQDSSYDRSGGNGDAGNFFARHGNVVVLSDIKGPGCIYRFWSANAAGQLRIYFDGEAAPRIDCAMQDLFLGKVAPFVAPLVGHKSGGWYCFFPMPFAKGCRIEVTDPGGMYYHVQFQRFPDKTPIRTFTTNLTDDDKIALNTVVSQWNRLGEDPKLPDDRDRRLTGTTACPPGQTRPLTLVNGPGEIMMLQMKPAPADRFALRQNVLRVYWDGAAKPGIEAPLGDFFGSGFGDTHYAALPSAMTDDGYVCYWPMPFRRSARFEIANVGAKTTSQLAWTITVRPLSKPLADAGYFHAQWHRQTTTSGEPFHILHTTGRGHYVGVHTAMQGDRGIWFLEGDEQIYADGDTFPSIHGTGTEDFYTGGWYFDEGTFSLAYHGCTYKDDYLSRVEAYRYQIQDCVPFQHELRVDIEHGPQNDYPGADYACTAYWYQDTPAHDWSPLDTAQLTPAVFRIADALEAESLPWSGGTTTVRPDSDLTAEASGGKVVSLSGDNPSCTLDVKADDVYTVQFMQLVQADTPLKWRCVIDGKEADALDLEMNNPADLKVGMRWNASQAARLTPGKHTLAFEIPAGKTITLDYIRLAPSRKEPGVIEAESLTERADTGGMGTVARVDGSEEWSGSSILEWHPSGDGAKLTLPVSVPQDGDYNLELGVIRDASSPVIAARLDDGPISGAITMAVSPAASSVQTVPMLHAAGLKHGAHTLTLFYQGKSGAVKTPVLALDYIRLRRSRYANALEAESLKVLDAADGEATHQDMHPFGPDWSGDSQFFFLAQKEGATATLELPVATTGTYALSLFYTTAPDYGIVQVLVDGQPVGGPTDNYTAKVLPPVKRSLGNVTLTAGTHRIAFRVVGKNAESRGWLVGVDVIGLEPAK